MPEPVSRQTEPAVARHCEPQSGLRWTFVVLARTEVACFARTRYALQLVERDAPALDQLDGQLRGATILGTLRICRHASGFIE
jgi:hypothetical protein